MKLWQLKSQELMFSVKADELILEYVFMNRLNWHEGGLECLDVFATVRLNGVDYSCRTLFVFLEHVMVQ